MPGLRKQSMSVLLHLQRCHDYSDTFHDYIRNDFRPHSEISEIRRRRRYLGFVTELTV